MKRSLFLSLWLVACGADAPPADTGGASLPEGLCGRGLVVVASDYVSSSVALTDIEGNTVSASMLSSGSTPPGLGAPLSGDVAAPAVRPASGRVVLLDRYPASVLTWVDPTTGAVEGQLAVSPGVNTNPQDYLEIDERRAYVTRYDSNPAPGAHAFDEGGDVLIVDHRAKKSIGRIPLPVEGTILPRPTRLLKLGAIVVVPLERMDRGFTEAADGMVVGVDTSTDTIAWTLSLPGLASCGAAAASPDEGTLVVLCSGRSADGPAAQLARSGVVVIDASVSPPAVIAVRRTPVAPSPFADLEDATYLLFVTYGDRDHGVRDGLARMDLSTGNMVTLHEAAPFTLGDVRCLHGCGHCVVTDAEQHGLRVVTPSSVGFVSVDSRGLPPRYVGRF